MSAVIVSAMFVSSSVAAGMPRLRETNAALLFFMVEVMEQKKLIPTFLLRDYSIQQ
jgi:hypothetical protein